MEGNQMKMRKALQKIRKIADINICECVGDYSDKAIIEIADAALAAPPRNCDVGTPEEQWKRYRRFCVGMRCCDCPVSGAECELAWAQMPYEAQEGGAE